MHKAASGSGIAEEISGARLQAVAHLEPTDVLPEQLRGIRALRGFLDLIRADADRVGIEAPDDLVAFSYRGWIYLDEAVLPLLPTVLTPQTIRQLFRHELEHIEHHTSTRPGWHGWRRPAT